MQASEPDNITLPLHNWEALQQLERERDYLSNVSAGVGAASLASGALVNPASFLLLALAYKPLVRVEKIARLIKVMKILLENFETEGIQIYPSLNIPGHEPLDFYIRFPVAQLLISIRSMKNSSVVYNERTEHLYTIREKGGLRKWLPCPLVELSDYQAWLFKNRGVFALSSRQVQKFPLAKVLLLWNSTTIHTHKEHLYSSLGNLQLLALKRKGTTFVIQEDKLVNFVKAYLEQYKNQT